MHWLILAQNGRGDDPSTGGGLVVILLTVLAIIVAIAIVTGIVIAWTRRNREVDRDSTHPPDAVGH